VARIPDSLKRRSLLNSKNESPQTLSELGRGFAAEGYLSDAVDFLAKAGDAEGLGELTPRSIEEGDYFLLTKIAKALGRKPEASELEALARNAERLGKLTFAARARADLEAPAGAGPEQTERTEAL
jgi:hypothetical protein